MKKLSFAFIFVCVFSWLSGQDIRDWIASKRPVLYEKVYLHLDRELYSTGDTLWFKAYHVNGMTHTLFKGYKNIYVQLVSPEGKVIASRLVLSINGESFGDIAIPDTLRDAQYTVRAYTKYLQHFGEESLFHQRIGISGRRNSAVFDAEKNQNTEKIEVMFFPEGGTLVANAVNHVAFKAINQSGKGAKVKGQIRDSSGQVVAEFSTRFLGMGTFVFMPEEGEKYDVEIEEDPGFHGFLVPEDKGVALHCRDSGDDVLVSLARNYIREEILPFYLVASHKGVVLFYQEMEIDQFTQGVRLPGNLFPRGISKISLLDPGFRMVAERLVFRNQATESLEVNVNRDEFTTREKVKLTVTSTLDEGDTLQSALSVSVVNENYLSSTGNNLSMESYLLIDSELKGPIESPAQYFIDEEHISSREKLDLLMMVQGWRRYYWDDIVARAPDDLIHWADAGLTVEGYVKRLFRDQPVTGGKVVLGPFSRNLLFEETKTDKNGRFAFDRLFLRDNVEVMINSKNERNRANSEIIPDPLFVPDSVVPVDSINKILVDMDVPTTFNRENYYRQMAEREFNPEGGNILLEEVDVYGRKPEEDDGHYRIYAEPDNSLTITEDDYFLYEDIFDYLTGRVGGVVVSGQEISIRGGGQPLFVLDGVIVESAFMDLIYTMNMRDIDKIEILKSMASASAYGSRGGDGVIAIYTRHGDNTSDYERYVKGRIVLQVNGFQRPNAFYSPVYTPENVNREKPDKRPTLYWNPLLEVSHKTAETEFFTGDDIAYYRIFVEGISKKGKICSGEKRLGVTRLNANQ
jgi:hypothetical protein